MDLTMLCCILNVICCWRYEDLQMFCVEYSRQVLLSAFRNMFCRKQLRSRMFRRHFSKSVHCADVTSKFMPSGFYKVLLVYMLFCFAIRMRLDDDKYSSSQFKIENEQMKLHFPVIRGFECVHSFEVLSSFKLKTRGTRKTLTGGFY